MAAIRILVVDDSVVIRRVLCEILSNDPQLEVVGTASNGRIGLAKIEQLHPDLVTLDVEMPVLNGLETLAELRKLHPKLPVVMFSTLTERGAGATLDALSLGASDYATKPQNASSAMEAIAAIRSELIPKIKALCPDRGKKVTPALPLTLRPVAKSIHHRIEIVTIGTSTGGPNALADVLPHIPKDFPVPIVLVQHMPPIFTRLLAERLSAHSEIPVQEGAVGTMLAPGHAWIAPGNFHMTVKRAGVGARLELNQGPLENSCRPAVDVLFRSVAEAYGPNVLGVVMTGMGSDGVVGARHIRERSGEVIVQDEASSVVWGMPGLVHAAGQADAVYPLNQLGQEITRRVLQSRMPRPLPAETHSLILETGAK
ncbi:MAG TPA: chemotaxis response regulator protein-glutamate methylesterase [Candidatus Aquilonibacter sp.]|jgi:two-component system chemotaxis response regulator CheB|nr:chemotaxis response regulator protein-glutamate methylesterase [Candidatus Aquilonibacter sp.]